MRIVRPSHLLHVNVICTRRRLLGSSTLALFGSTASSSFSSPTRFARASVRARASTPFASRARRDHRETDGGNVARAAARTHGRRVARAVPVAEDDARALELARTLALVTHGDAAMTNDMSRAVRVVE
tara:strand:+ start:1644 stop:2027 length:384 start_codon:yes stop_codon:yes gene_type:complete